MPVTIVVGGQYGSEGKGKVAAFFANKLNAHAVIRCGGSNSGHTVYDQDNNKFVFRHLPTACLQSSIINILVAGSYIDVDLLFSEIAHAGVSANKLFIDPYAVIITDAHKEEEARGRLGECIGSTGSGTGAAVKQRLLRLKDTVFAKDVPELAPYIKNTKEIIHQFLLANKRLILEGTQGYGLSLLHSTEFPYVTTRDTTAAGFASEAGISPLYIDDVVLVIRAFPIRVAGNSGPLVNELSWNQVAAEAKKRIEPELTSVTKQERRIARFDADLVKSAIKTNAPTAVVLNHVDYFPDTYREESIRDIESVLCVGIDWVGDNPVDLKIRNSFRSAVVGE